MTSVFTTSKATRLLAFIILSTSVFIHSCKKKDDTQPQESNTGSQLMQSPETGSPLQSGSITKFEFVFKGTEVLLALADNTQGKLFIADVKDSDPQKAADYEITSNINQFAQGIASGMGITIANFRIVDMKINPVSKALYMLIRNASNNQRYLIRVIENGANYEMVNLENIQYVELAYPAGSDRLLDLSWGENKLYMSFNHSSTLKGAVASVAAPFSKNKELSSRATTVFKTNWGGQYFTDAPLETMTWLKVKGEERLAGVTVCAPGFSFPVADMESGSGVLEVRENFNLNTTYAIKVFPVAYNNQTRLVEFHDNGRITLVGEKYIDGSHPDFNANSPYLLSNNGTQVSSGMTADDVQILVEPGIIIAVAKYSDNRLLLITNNGGLDYNFQIQ